MISRFLPILPAVAALAICSISSAQVGQTPPNAPAPKPPAPSAQPPAAPPDPASEAIAQAIIKKNKNDIDGALAKLSEAIQLDPKNAFAYYLRGSIYSEKKQLPEAEADFTAAAKIAPKNLTLKVNLAAIKFMQKQYDAARAGYLPLTKDLEMGDFASYNVFLCDLAGGHDELAAKELAVFNKAETGASYYFGNAAWNVAHKKYDEARKWFESAARIFDPHKSAYYAEPLYYIGYLPLPKPTTPTATP